MKVDKLKEDPKIKIWFSQLNSPETIRNYSLAMYLFTEKVKKSPVQLIEEAKKEVKKGVDMEERKILTYLTEFRKSLEDNGLAPLTVKTYMTGVKSFYKYNYVQLPHLSKKPARTLKKNKFKVSKDDLRDILKVADPLAKAVVLVGLSSGVSTNEIRNLKVSDFKEGYDPETLVTTLDLTRHKTDFDFVTFLTPEATKAVDTYLEYRARTINVKDVKRERQLDKQKIIKDSNYLFILRNIPKSYSKTLDDKERQLTTGALMRMYRSLCVDAQKTTEKGTWNKLRSHTMRKFFSDTLYNGECGMQHYEEFMGHKLPGVQEHYISKDPKELKKIFMKYMHLLVIQEENDISKNPDFLRAKEESEEFRRLASIASVENIQLQSLNNKIKEMKQEILNLKEKDAEEESIKAEIMAVLVAKQFPKEFANSAAIEDELTKMRTNPAYAQMLKKYEYILENSDKPEEEIMLEEDEKESKYKRVMNKLLEM